MAAAALLVTLTSLVTGLLGATLLQSYLLGRSDSQLRSFASIAGRIFTRAHAPVAPAGHQALPTQFAVEVATADGGLQRAGGPLHDPSLTAAQLRAGHAVYGGVRPSGSVGRSAACSPRRPAASVTGTVTGLRWPTRSPEGSRRHLAAVALPLVRASLAPLTRIEDTAVAIAAGDLSRRIDHPQGSTEVGRLARALDAMLTRIETAYQARADGEARAVVSEERMRQFIADASHELRTPLTSVRALAAHGLQQGEAAAHAELLTLLQRVEREASRMGQLVEDLLLLARLDAGRPLNKSLVDLASIAAEAVQATRVMHRERRVTLVAPEPVVVAADGERVRQIVDNLLSNAVRHTPAGSPVTVTVTGVADGGQLDVTDAGSGMTPEQAARVFERFYRTDGARGRSSGGAGLGLAIAASLTAAHGGQLTVDTAPGQGATFRLRLPASGLPG